MTGVFGAKDEHLLRLFCLRKLLENLKSRDLKQHRSTSFSGEYSCVWSEEDGYMDFVVVVVLIEPTGSISKQNKIRSKISK